MQTVQVGVQTETASACPRAGVPLHLAALVPAPLAPGVWLDAQAEEVAPAEAALAGVAASAEAVAEVSMSRADFEACLDSVARRVAAEAGRSHLALTESSVADLQRVVAQRDDVMGRVESCTNQLQEAEKELAQRGLLLARAQPAVDAYDKLLPHYRLLVQERAAMATAAAGPPSKRPGCCDLWRRESGGDADLREYVACETCWGRLDLLVGKWSEKQVDEEGEDCRSEYDALCTVCLGAVNVEDEEEAAHGCGV